MDNVLETKLDKIDETLAKQHDTLIRLTVTVEEHVRRSNMLEAEIKTTNVRIDAHDTLIDKAKGVFWLIARLTGILSAGAWLFKILR
jgi:ribosome-associated translation inhibitor RaiA